ncbi:glucose 1-dehydrogenase [Sphingobium sp.]|uniref:glucose 1-dehydrogenase n=1 Tax=Sphingobium TaxID=165695 RepID=UPI001A2CA2C8|nr:glucose 1-dehydrogenase [Sphingobium sp.]MBJ7375688.1 glucose 1-dehydrogenase [Sphingobium sp.]
MDALANKAAIVTGAGSGIGRASACAMARSGAHVMVSDIDEWSAMETVQIIRDAGGIAQACCGDVTQAEFAERLVAATIAAFGTLDIAHNNAGVEAAMAPVGDALEADFDRVIAVNLKGVWLCMRAQIRQMSVRGKGAIVNTASVGGLVGVPGNAAYSAAKHGVVGLSKSAAVEYATAGIRINALCPGLTRSGMTDRVFAARPELKQQIMPPMQRLADPAEIAATVVFLLSDVASYMTGQAIAVDGAATAI